MDLDLKISFNVDNMNRRHISFASDQTMKQFYSKDQVETESDPWYDWLWSLNSPTIFKDSHKYLPEYSKGKVTKHNAIKRRHIGSMKPGSKDLKVLGDTVSLAKIKDGKSHENQSINENEKRSLQDSFLIIRNPQKEIIKYPDPIKQNKPPLTVSYLNDDSWTGISNMAIVNKDFKDFQKLKIFKKIKRDFGSEIKRRSINKMVSNAFCRNSLNDGLRTRNQICSLKQLSKNDHPFLTNEDLENEERKRLKRPTNIYMGHGVSISNLIDGYNAEALKDLFANFGEIVGWKKMPNMICVEYKYPDMATEAICELQEFIFEGNALKLTFRNYPQYKQSVYERRAEMSQILGECFKWRTSGCILGMVCKYSHKEANKAIDPLLKPMNKKR